MKKMIYLCESRFNKLSDYEKEQKRISYRTLINYYDMPLVLCNKIVEVDKLLLDNVLVGSLYDEEEDYYIDIYQYYITDLSEWGLENIQELYNDELIICYSEVLDNYILCVDHFGTSWDYVLTDIEWTTDYEKYKKWEEEYLKEKEL